MSTTEQTPSLPRPVLVAIRDMANLVMETQHETPEEQGKRWCDLIESQIPEPFHDAVTNLMKMAYQEGAAYVLRDDA